MTLATAIACTPAAIPEATARRLPAEAALPAIPLVTLDGGDTDLPAVVRDRAALVSFWATWCDACIEEMPSLNRLAARTAARTDARVVGVAIGEDRGAVGAFVAAHRLTYAQLVDTDFHLTDALGERRIPATLVIDRRGRIVYRGGALDGSALAAFRRALGE